MGRNTAATDAATAPSIMIYPYGSTSSPRDRMIAELSIRRAMDAFHRTLEHVRAA